MHLINKNVFRLRMTTQKLYHLLFLSTLACTASLSYADSPVETSDSSLPTYTLPTLTVRGQEIANLRPASTFQSVVSNLDFDPRMDFQSRNMAEAQGDINIRGGIFEGTGIQVGAATLIDPQTGHYSTELPIAPEMLSQPNVYTGSENAFYGFNSTAGTISYQWNQMATGGSLTLGTGENDLKLQRIHNAINGNLNSANSWTWGAEFELSHSESDGTIAYGNHDFDRSTGRFQIIGPDSQTDFFLGKQSKFFGWPRMYTGMKNDIFAYEFEDLDTRLLMINYKKVLDNDNFINLSVSKKDNSDYYLLDARKTYDKPIEEEEPSSEPARTEKRNKDIFYEVNHDTEVKTFALNGLQNINQNFSLYYSSQVTADKWKKQNEVYIETDTEEPSPPLFSKNYDPVSASRSYLKLTLLPEYSLNNGGERNLKLRLGGSYDYSNKDSSAFSFIGDVKWIKNYSNGDIDITYFSYSESSQVPGYVAIGNAEKTKDDAKSIFESSPLGREKSKNLEFGIMQYRNNFRIEATAFYRWDKDLVDWCYKEGNESARTATGLDIDTFGFEVIASKKWNAFEAITSYTLLDKNEDYGSEEWDGSFYALNYAKQRITLGAIWSPNDLLKVRVDNEWRVQEKNVLRNSDNEALFTHLSLSIFPPKHPGLELFAAIDNAWNEDFEDVPGTPGKGRQGSCGATFKW